MSTRTGINNAGQIVGYTVDGDGVSRAALWIGRKTHAAAGVGQRPEIVRGISNQQQRPDRRAVEV